MLFLVCIEGKYGNNCTSACDCEQNNTQVCDHINGSCTCSQVSKSNMVTK